jgi:hypothetical protein
MSKLVWQGFYSRCAVLVENAAKQPSGSASASLPDQGT